MSIVRDELLRAILVALTTGGPPAGAASAAKQDIGNDSLAAILAKIIAAPATAAKQDSLALEVRKPTGCYRLFAAAATTNAASIKDSSGDVHTIFGHTFKADEVFLKLYNKATAPIVGTDVPVVTLRLLRSVAFSYDLRGLNFPLGIGIAITLGQADADTTATLANDVLGLNIIYA